MISYFYKTVNKNYKVTVLLFTKVRESGIIYVKSFRGTIELTKLILKLFVDNKQRTPSDRRFRIGVVGGACGIILNLILAAFKALAGILFGSIAIIADAVNNLTDAASSVITLVGFKLASKKPDSDHPYGHGRMEYLSGLVMAFIVLLLGVSLAKSSVEGIINPSELKFSYLSVVILSLSVLAKVWLALFYKKLEKQTDSKTFAAASADSRNDAVSTSAVLVCTILHNLFDLHLDGYVGLVVSVLILLSGIGLIKETIDPLLGQPPSKELVDEIYTRTMSHNGVIGIHDLVVHNYGPGRIFASLHAEVPADCDMLESHDMIDNIEKEFREQMNLEMVIHIDPVVVDDPTVNELKELVMQIVKDIDKTLNIHDFRMVSGPTHTNLIFDVVLPCEFEQNEKSLKNEIDKRLSEKRPDCFTVIVFDRSYV